VPTFRFAVNTATYNERVDPNYPGVIEHSFYIQGKNMPEGIPSGCNPRDQNIDKGIYKTISESYCDVTDPSFHLKNKGITVLAKRVRVTHAQTGGLTHLEVDIPDYLGGVDGYHTYKIVVTNKTKNPDQYVEMKIKEGLPESLIPPVAKGLNTGMQVTLASMANFENVFEPIHKVLESKPYYKYIKFKDNQEGTCPTDSKDLVNLMWAACPGLFKDDNEKHPGWIFHRQSYIFEKGFFATEENKVRTELNRMVRVLPTLCDVYIYLLDEVETYYREPRGGKIKENTLPSLFKNVKKLPFRDPEDNSVRHVISDAYYMMIFSGLRYMLKYNERTGFYQWTIPERRIYQVLDASLKSCLNRILKNLKDNRGDHTRNGRAISVWDVVASEVRTAYLTLPDDDNALDIVNAE
jgi:hypothetical protein